MAWFVSAEEIVDQFRYPSHVSWAPAVDHAVAVGTVGPRGYTHVVVSASIEHWRSRTPALAGVGAIEALADRYVAFWNDSEGIDATDLYDDAASVEDTLLGHSLQGVDALRAAAGTRAWPDLPHLDISAVHAEARAGATSSLPPVERAVYFGPSGPGSTHSGALVLLLRADDGSGCPGPLAVAMSIDHGRITSERRYHDVDSAGRCFDTGTLASGWWDGIEVPEPVVRELTGTVTRPEPRRSVAVYNGTSEANAYVRWGLEQFADAGLALPKVDSVTFALDQGACPLLRRGVVRYDRSGADVSLCFQADRVCADADCSGWTAGAARTLLHEYAHAWMAQNLSATARQAFLDLAGVPRWEDLDDEWSQRGVEQAAITVTSGLMNVPVAPALLPCGAFAARFRLLTGVAPLAPCSP